MRPHVCPWWFAYTFDNPFRRLFHNPEKMLAPYVRKGDTALDIGCGMGYFSMGLAGLVGGEGAVIAADIQPRMLAAVKRRAARNGVADIIRTHESAPDDLGLATPVDFALAFWMAHEAPDADRLFRQVRACLKPDGRFLVVEPKHHVPEAQFNSIIDLAVSTGLSVAERPKVALSRAALLGHRQ